MYFPVFYMIKDFVTSGPEKADPVKAVNEYIGNMHEDLIALWKVWIPSTFLNFAFMPMWARIPWVASTSLIWTCILSAMRGSSDVPANNVFAGVDKQTMELVKRTVVGPPPYLDPNRSHVLIIARGPDRPGIISDLTKKVATNQATVTTSKMLSLGSEFSIMMHAEVPHEQLGALTSAVIGDTDSASRIELPGTIIATSPDGLTYTIRSLPSAAGVPSAAFSAKLWLTGPDKPGLLFRLTEAVSDSKLNIEHLQTEQHSSLMPSGEKLFSAHCHVVAPTAEAADVAGLKRRLAELEGSLGVRCSLEVTKS